MRPSSKEKLSELQQNQANIRNICILAHVDHGKTTLADTLVASNGIISQRMAGKLRYLDSREDEQLRGITMKSSAISLHYATDSSEYLVNLIDSPGHIDFSSEVSTAVRLCDGALILVDVVEGVCPQTHAVLRQAWLENIKPVLVLNKIDRLIIELKMTPLEAHLHLEQVLEQVNAITGELYTTEVMEKAANKSNGDVHASADPELYDWSAGLEEVDDASLYFSPDQANVIFASAIDGWGFGINHFAELFASKLGLNAAVLRQTLWGDFYLEAKTKMVRKGAQAKGKKPMFVQFILENMWAVYDAIYIRRDKEKIEKIVKSLNLKLAARDARHTDAKVQLQAVCSQWLPLSKAVLAMVIEKLPSPLEISAERVEKLLCSHGRRFDSLPAKTQLLKQDFLACSPDKDSPVIVFISKMFPIERKALPQHRQRPLTHEEITERRESARKRHAEKITAAAQQTEVHNDSSSMPVVSSEWKGQALEVAESREQVEESEQVFLAFARVFSGTVRRGQRLYILGPKHDPANAIQEGEDIDTSLRVRDLGSSEHVMAFNVDSLFLFMGRELEALEEIPAGNVLGIGGLEEYVLKSATVSSSLACPAFTDMYFEAAPIVRVAIEPRHPGDMKRLVEGMKLLNQADQCVEVLVQETGEHVLVTAGEVHLEKCLDDIRQRFGKVEVNVSAPIVPFRETIISPPKLDRVNEAILEPSQPVKSQNWEDGEEPEIVERGLVEIQTPNKLCSMRIRAEPLPEQVTTLLNVHPDLTKMLDQYSTSWISGKQSEIDLSSKLNQETISMLRDFKANLAAAFESAGNEWADSVEHIWAFGPRRNGPNILLNKVPGYHRLPIWSCIEKNEGSEKFIVWDYDTSVISGFQMATLAGPLCQEPMMGVCFIIEKLNFQDASVSEYSKPLTICKSSDTSSNCNSTLVEPKKHTCDDNLNTDVLGLSINERPLHRTEAYNLTCRILPTETPETSDIRPGTPCSPATPSNPITIVTPSSHITMATPSSPVNPSSPVTMITPGSPVSPGSPESPADTGFSKRIETYGPFTGQIMSCIKEGCRKAFQTQPQRLMAAMYTCVIQATADVLGKLYAVLGKRTGQVLYEDMREGSSLFNITAVIPVIESFGFSEDIRKKTSGLARPQLKFSHWQVVDIDPFWVPTTEEEYMQYGEKADSYNRARNYMDQVRRRKGLKVEEKLVEFAEKQRTLKKNK